MFEELKEQIKVVVEAREKASAAYLAKNQSYMRWEEDNKPLIENTQNAKLSLEAAEAKLHLLTLAAYEETGNKKPAVGVGIQERTVLNYNLDEAFAWAKEHGMALSLDRRAFEKIAKADPPDCVTIILEPRATIATDLKVIE